MNDYLATRDAEWMGAFTSSSRMSVGTIVHGQSDWKQAAYRCHITYGTNNEFGFDYLRDNMKESIERTCSAISTSRSSTKWTPILIDEARTPLIISGPADKSAQLYYKVNQIVPRFKKDIDYTVDESITRRCSPKRASKSRRRCSASTTCYDAQNIEWNHHVQQALRAHTLYKRDVNYMVTDEGKVVIIDEFTGRLMPGRRWSDGLHQASRRRKTSRSKKRRRRWRRFRFRTCSVCTKLAGMTGTADTEAEEFHKIYKLDVVMIPTNLSMVRKDRPRPGLQNERGKFRAVIEEDRRVLRAWPAGSRRHGQR